MSGVRLAGPPEHGTDTEQCSSVLVRLPVVLVPAGPDVVYSLLNRTPTVAEGDASVLQMYGRN